ncbi:MAG: acylphosphatase [Rhodanobacter sp.]|nr:MAG: acylphosphatase [Rhodanobacter sp.]TAM08181.1 MAG: acylphosphatase [Rhodanobacter sp.]TAM36043.1 MAG: acylphosphatase [Rhodanobacter sp.]
MPAARFLVSGRVQGVFFRASAREKASVLGLAGSATNLADGRVEVIAEGSAPALVALERWLWQGPPAAKVVAVAREDIAEAARSGFVTG